MEKVDDVAVAAKVVAVALRRWSAFEIWALNPNGTNELWRSRALTFTQTHIKREKRKIKSKHMESCMHDASMVLAQGNIVQILFCSEERRNWVHTRLTSQGKQCHIKRLEIMPCTHAQTFKTDDQFSTKRLFFVALFSFPPYTSVFELRFFIDLKLHAVNHWMQSM